jgi:hypothetical protein
VIEIFLGAILRDCPIDIAAIHQIDGTSFTAANAIMLQVYRR